MKKWRDTTQRYFKKIFHPRHCFLSEWRLVEAGVTPLRAIPTEPLHSFLNLRSVKFKAS